MRVLAVLLASVLLLAGCGGTDPVPKEPKRSASPAAPSATLPTMPAAASQNTEAGAIAFVKHYIDVFNYASNTGDVDELKRLSDPTCEGCNSYITLYQDTYADGGYFKDSDWALDNFETRSQGKFTLVITDLSASRGSYKTDADDSVHESSPERSKLDFLPVWSSGSWKIFTFERLAK